MSQAEQRAFEEMFEALLAHSLEPVLLSRPDGAILRANSAACRVLGRAERELQQVGRAGVLVHDEAALAFIAERARNARAQGEVRFRRPDGTTFPAEIASSSVTLASGEPLNIVSFRDVTERKRAEAALRESEERARVALDAAQLGTWRHDLGTDLFRFDARAAEHFGVDGGGSTAAEVLAKVHPDDAARLRDVMAESLDPRGPGRYALECRVVLPAGAVRWVAVHARVRFEGEGSARRAVLAIGTSQDVTERKRNEDALRATAERLRIAFATSPEGIAITRLSDGLIESANESYARMMGRDADELAGGRTLDFGIWGRAEDRARFVELIGRVGSVRGYRSRGRRKDGSRFVAELSAQVFTVGEERFMLCVVRDVTERERAEEELRRLAAAVEQTPASVVITDDAGLIQFVNPAFERVTGFAREEVLGLRPSVLKSGEHGVDFYRALWATIGAGEVWKGRIVNRTKGGRVFQEDAVIAPVRDATGAIRNYVAVKRDVTDELALQEALVQAQRLESVGRLAGGIAHDFNNLLTVVLSCADELKRGLAGAEAPLRDDVEEILAAGERARALTRQLLAFARQQVIAPVALDLNDVVRGSERLLRRLIGEDIDLAVALQPDLWTVSCDPAQMEQVVLNLAVNARDALPRGGKLLLETGNMELGVVEAARFPGAVPGSYVRLTVQDDGTGMAAEVRARAFEPFFTTKPQGKGTGLGLATVHGIVHQSGGVIQVESQVGYGTKLDMLFPRVTGRPEAAPPPPVEAPRGGDERILLVEDEASVREVIARALRNAGYDVHPAATGREAVALVSSGLPIHLVISDVIMPGMNGPQVVAAIRAARPQVRYLFVSGHPQDVILRRGVLERDIELLGKPFTSQALLARVREVLDRRP